MCGLVGFTDPGPDAEDVIRAMMSTIRYRGPDACGTHLDRHIALGHLRLAVVAPEGGQQPRHDAASGDVLVFNGEIYDYASHAADLRAKGITLRDASDTEVLFQMIRVFGVVEALERVEGMFAFAFRHGASGKVTLARDRFGEKPLYYALRGRRLIFASEPKALLRHPACAAWDFDLEAIGQYLTFDYVPGPRSGFTDLAKLLPGHIAEFDGTSLLTRSYWQLPIETRNSADHEAGLDEASTLDRLEQCLVDSIKSRLVADVPIGLFLSGGIDSALIAALTAAHAPGIAAYTIKLPGQGYDETPYAARVAETFGLSHSVRELSDGELLGALDRIEGLMDEPFADPSIVPTYLLCETARQGVTVALGGDGGDELFAGYINFQARRFAHLMAHLPKAAGAALRGALARLPTSDRYMGLGFKLGQLSQGFGQPEPLQSFLWMAPFDEGHRRRLISRAIPAKEDFAPVTAWLDRKTPGDPVELMQYLFTTLYLPDDILTKVDRASMYNSLEVRAPFLSRPLAELAFSLPSRWRVKGRQTKVLLRKLAERHLPADIVQRPKHGFALPVAALLRGSLRERVQDVLLDPGNPLAGHFARPELERLVQEHMTKQRDHRKRLWSLYCLFGFAATAKQNSAASLSAKTTVAA